MVVRRDDTSMAARTGTAHATIELAVDLAILTVRAGQLQVLLIERGNEPYRGEFALPGGFLRDDETLSAAALRELRDETGLSVPHLRMQQLHAFDVPNRDPRGRVIAVPYLAIAPDLPTPIAGTDASAAHWVPVDAVGPGHIRLAFDHEQILASAVARAGYELEHSTVATTFCQNEFTIGDLRRVYEAVWGVPVDPRNFNRKVIRTEGFVVAAEAKRAPTAGRPAALYRRGPATVLYPPMLRANIKQRGAIHEPNPR